MDKIDISNLMPPPRKHYIYDCTCPEWKRFHTITFDSEDLYNLNRTACQFCKKPFAVIPDQPLPPEPRAPGLVYPEDEGGMSLWVGSLLTIFAILFGVAAIHEIWKHL